MKTVKAKMLKAAVRFNEKQFPEELKAGQEVQWDANDALRAAENGLIELLSDEIKRK